MSKKQQVPPLQIIRTYRHDGWWFKRAETKIAEDAAKLAPQGYVITSQSRSGLGVFAYYTVIFTRVSVPSPYGQMGHPTY